jgi:transposase
MAKRKQYSNGFKAQVAVEAIQSHKTLAQIASEYSVHPNQVTLWKKQALSGLPELFTSGRKNQQASESHLVDELYRQIGQLKVELHWLQKKTGFHP